MFGFNSKVEELRGTITGLERQVAVHQSAYDRAWQQVESEREFHRMKVEELESKLKDLQFQKDTLETLLKGLRIAVKLPVRAR